MDEFKDVAFRKVDLHIHTPESLCYSDPSVTSEQIVGTALSAGLDLIAITDHNTAEGIDGIRQVAGEKGLSVFPGIELSPRGGHVIAVFELDTPVEKLRDFLDYVGVPRDSWGDGTITVGISIEEAFQEIEKRGGIAIAAHIERWPSGFLETNEPRRVKMRIYSNKYLSALEITVPHSKDIWNGGKKRGYPRKHACIQGSDAHALEDIGRRPVYIQMEKVDLASLRSAFNDYGTRIVFPDEFALSQ